MTRKIHQPIALNARAHEHTRVLRHSIIFVHAYNKVIDTKYRICKIELFSEDIILGDIQNGLHQEFIREG